MRPSDVGLSHLFQVLPDPALVLDLDNGQVLLLNPAAEALLGRLERRCAGTAPRTSCRASLPPPERSPRMPVRAARPRRAARVSWKPAAPPVPHSR